MVTTRARITCSRRCVKFIAIVNSCDADPWSNKSLPYPVSECVRHTAGDDQKCYRSAYFPKPPFVLIDADAFEVHTKITRKEREGKEYDGNDSENKNGLVLAISDDSKLILLDGSDLEELDNK